MKYQCRLMRGSERRFRSSPVTQQSKALSSPAAQSTEALSSSFSPASPPSSDCGSDDTILMSKSNHHHSRSLSLKIPSVTFHGPRQPTLDEVLSNEAPSPWTLSAFMAYLSQNHCLETLEFTMDAAKYEKHYHAMMSQTSSGTTGDALSVESENVRKLWSKLLDAYIKPNGPREVNLPSDVRDKLVSLPCTSSSPPEPSELVKAVRITYELMDQSVLVPFLNSLTPRSNESLNSPWPSQVSTASSVTSSERSSTTPRSRRNSQTRIISENNSGSNTAQSPRPTYTARSTCRISSFIFGPSLSPPNSSESADSSTDDDNPSTYSIVTPPSTPPESGSGWKKVSAKFCYRKKNRTYTPLPSNPTIHETSCNVIL